MRRKAPSRPPLFFTWDGEVIRYRSENPRFPYSPGGRGRDMLPTARDPRGKLDCGTESTASVTRHNLAGSFVRGPFIVRRETMSCNSRWIASAAGALAAGWGLSRRSYTGLAVAVGGGCLAYWGATGRWPALPRGIAIPDAVRQSLGGRFAAAPGTTRHGMPQTGTDPQERAWIPPADVDPVDEASMDSFPASDPPSYMSSSATPSRPR